MSEEKKTSLKESGSIDPTELIRGKYSDFQKQVDVLARKHIAETKVALNDARLLLEGDGWEWYDLTPQEELQIKQAGQTLPDVYFNMRLPFKTPDHQFVIVHDYDQLMITESTGKRYMIPVKDFTLDEVRDFICDTFGIKRVHRSDESNK